MKLNEIINELNNGNEDLWYDFFLKVEKMSYGLAKNKSIKLDDDLLQDIKLNVFKSIKLINSNFNNHEVTGYLYGIIKNTLALNLQYNNRAKRKAEIICYSDDFVKVDVIHIFEHRDLLDSIINKMDMNDLEINILFFNLLSNKPLKLDEIAIKSNVSKSTAYATKNNMINKMRKIYNNLIGGIYA